MTTQTANYDTPAVYLPRLIEWADQGAEHYASAAEMQRRKGFTANAAAYEDLAACWSQIADRARARLLREHELTLADVQADDQEPPSQLVLLVDYIRERLGRSFPSAPSEVWQGIACVLLAFRRTS